MNLESFKVCNHPDKLSRLIIYFDANEKYNLRTDLSLHLFIDKKKPNSRFANIYIGNVVLFIFVGLFIGIPIVIEIIFIRIEIIIIRT